MTSPVPWTCGEDTSAWNNLFNGKAFMTQFENPAMVTEEMQVGREAQDNTRTYEEL